MCGAGLLGLVFLILLSAFFRAIRASMSWYNDLAMLLLAWTAFLGADVAWRGGQIIGVDLLTRRFTRVLQKIIFLIIYIIILGALVVMVVFGIRLAWTERLERFQSMPLPYTLVTISLVVASFSMVFSTIGKIWKTILALTGKDVELTQIDSVPVPAEDKPKTAEDN